MKTYQVIVEDDGTISWYMNGRLHREDGPAIERADGNKYWYINDKQHREDGPAVEYRSGNKYWFINDEELSEEEFLARTSTPSCEGKVVEIDGKKYKLTAV